MSRKIIVIIGLTITVLFLCGCTDSVNRETGTWIKIGKVTKIDYNRAFGGTFTDWRDDIFFEDGTILFSQDKDLSSIRLNETGRFVFEKNYFTYDSHRYRFDNFVSVSYDEI